MIIPCKIGGVVTIGYEGENNAREYHFDITRYQQAWPDGRPQMLVTRSDGENYIADTVVDGTNLVWIVKRSDVACPGDGSMYIAFLNDANELMGYTEKTTLIVEDMPDWMDGDTPPPAYESWIATILLAGDAARTGAAEAKESAAAALNSEQNAANSEQNAANSEQHAADSEQNAANSAEAAANSAAAAELNKTTTESSALLAAKSAAAAEAAQVASADHAEAAEAAKSASADHAAAASMSASVAEANANAARNTVSATLIAQQKAENAEAEAEAAAAAGAQSAAEAAAAAEAAKASVAGGGYVFFDINQEGHLVMTKSENVETLEFQLIEGRLNAVYG